MFDIGWDEMALIAAVSLIVIGPKDLPVVLRQVGRWTRKARLMATDFQRGFDDMVRESELEEVKQQIVKATDPSLLRQEIDRTVDPDGELARAMTLPPPDTLHSAAPAPVPEPIPADAPPSRPPAP
ncbi:Sec-independent protein translocase protein TatB [Magnetospirillum molischianum]|uniref:Sec-independent protein translocase protein TatB n=1 Tax=Magnetospirillum molischianum DSM 120 TaxID=1150626 RepID=H8FRS3_MAGML|nr:Sec-independent protein translocase protein TatB [Magnetospirillum molischianum]CCG41061.1 Sec-independent protein translocase protein tatB homolog [Magnetospirillum molischianum DSM 120]